MARSNLKLGEATADLNGMFDGKVTCPQCGKKVKVPRSGYCPTKGCTQDFHK